MRLIDRLIGFVPWLLAPLLVAGVVHISSLLLVPIVAPKSALVLQAEAAPVGRVTLLDAVAPGANAIPFEDPAAALAMCRFDLAGGPMRLAATLADDRMMLFSFHRRNGTIFYSMSDRGAPRNRLDVLIVTKPQLDAIEDAETDESTSQELRIVAPDTQGFVLMRSYADQPSDLPLARDRAAAVGCAADRPKG